ncbi:hypothetical protein CANMA_000002 [Candida margitis]|uniref:uncharacterized protein n=1 Tax=Candida margitis TaxID=1775924 RepID=UPI002226E1E7|nr:uncharacterized protein CANMA_000002 [Candida margitis]KAI5970842.1 hypothetical protein CANMA_000002 [Candida margitis]
MIPQTQAKPSSLDTGVALTDKGVAVKQFKGKDPKRDLHGKHSQQQQNTTTLPTSPASLDNDNQGLKPPMFTFDGDEVVTDEQQDQEGQPYDQYDTEAPAIFERSVQDCCSPHRTNSIISLTNTLNNYTPTSSSNSAGGISNSLNNNNSTTSITNLHSNSSTAAIGGGSSRRKSIIKRPRSSTTNSFNRLEDSFTPLNSLITSFDSSSAHSNVSANTNLASSGFPLSPNSPPKLRHTQSQMNCCSYAELISDESWSNSPFPSNSGAGAGTAGLSGKRGQPPIRSTQSSGVVPTLRSPKWKK